MKENSKIIHKETKKAAAVVVTYNRKELLRKCINCLLAQNPEVPHIIIIDNHSTDGTKEYLLEFIENKDIEYFDTGRNLGGAGGFNVGLRKAIETGYEYLWLMDDDVLPASDTLEKLLDSDKRLNGAYGWLSSVAIWTDGTECKMNRQKLKKSFYKYSPYMKYGLVQAEQATFVSLFLRAETVRRVGLPIKDFFIWGDDIEYTRRIAVRENIPSFVAGQSQVIHAMKENNGSSIATDTAERIGRYRFAFRNEAFTYRQEGFKGICYYLAKCGVNFCRIIIKAPNRRCRRIRILIESMFEGIFFHPKIERID